MTVFYSKISPNLRLGPGTEEPGIVRFRDGFAEVALDDPNRAAKLSWIAGAAGEYGIEDLGEPSESAVDAPSPACPTCGRPASGPKRMGRPILRSPTTPTGQWNPPLVASVCRGHGSTLEEAERRLTDKPVESPEGGLL